jgi:hypothetical protein
MKDCNGGHKAHPTPNADFSDGVARSFLTAADRGVGDISATPDYRRAKGRRVGFMPKLSPLFLIADQ